MWGIVGASLQCNTVQWLWRFDCWPRRRLWRGGWYANWSLPRTTKYQRQDILGKVQTVSELNCFTCESISGKSMWPSLAPPAASKGDAPDVFCHNSNNKVITIRKVPNHSSNKIYNEGVEADCCWTSSMRLGPLVCTTRFHRSPVVDVQRSPCDASRANSCTFLINKIY